VLEFSGAVVLDLTSVLDDLEETFGFWCCFPWNDFGPASEAICFEMAHVERYNMSVQRRFHWVQFFFFLILKLEPKRRVLCRIDLLNHFGETCPSILAQETRLELLQKLSEMIGTFS